jgi:SAM-dependent methyltransferase
MMDRPLVVPDPAFDYLIAQRGALDDMRGDRHLWLAKYGDVLASEFASIEHFLPPDCDSILDVGGGMGGIDVLLNRHYGGDCLVTILDGMEDPPRMEKHRQTFSHAGIARQFLETNGVRRVRTIDANNPPAIAPDFYDLVVSFKSWCFHYEPERYLRLISTGLISDRTYLIVDVRKERRYDWIRALQPPFKDPTMIFYGAKFETYRLVAQ